MPPFSEQLHQASKSLHIEAERSGVIAQILKGAASVEAYSLYLRSLHPAYEALEQGLALHQYTHAVGQVARAEVYRAESLAADLNVLAGPDWRTDLPVLPEASAYADVIDHATEDGGERLIAHAYTRYMGDLSGGQIMARLLGERLGLPPGALGFYRFDQIADMPAYKSAYRSWLDAAGALLTNPPVVAQEAQVAFRLNIDVSVAVARHVSGVG